jgi:hypothetical protein
VARRAAVDAWQPFPQLPPCLYVAAPARRRPKGQAGDSSHYRIIPRSGVVDVYKGYGANTPCWPETTYTNLFKLVKLLSIKKNVQGIYNKKFIVILKSQAWKNGEKMSVDLASGQPVIIVSGLPRSGTSLMMQMLQAGGLEILSDGNRQADSDNPKGYLEYEPVKALRRDNSWLKMAQGKAVKVISSLLPYLHPDLSYRIIFMKRPLAEVISSQQKMLERLGQREDPGSFATLEKMLARQSAETERWLQDRQHMAVLAVRYRDIVRHPQDTALTVSRFLDLPLDLTAMCRVVDPSLYRNIAK